MADHKAEQILAAFQQVLKDSATVDIPDTSIVRDRVDPAGAWPDISVNMGSDDVVEGSDNNMAFMDNWLNVYVKLSVKNSTGLSTELNSLRKKIHIAIYADTQLGLSGFVMQGRYTGASDIAVSGAVEKETAEQTLNYQFKYRHALTDPSA